PGGGGRQPFPQIGIEGAQRSGASRDASLVKRPSLLVAVLHRTPGLDRPAKGLHLVPLDAYQRCSHPVQRGAGHLSDDQHTARPATAPRSADSRSPSRRASHPSSWYTVSSRPAAPAKGASQPHTSSPRRCTIAKVRARSEAKRRESASASAPSASSW